jgi:hypothetical protein
MAKEARPSMPFYGKDGYDDINVQEMDYAEQGIYLRLCWLCWTEGGVPDDGERLARILKVADPIAFVQHSFVRLRGCFNAIDGTLVHGKIEKIRAELEDYRRAKAEAGRKGAESRWHSHDSANGRPDGKAWPSSPSPSPSPSSFPSSSSSAEEQDQTCASQSDTRVSDHSLPQLKRKRVPIGGGKKASAEQVGWFDQFWAAYWLRKSKKDAFAAFCKNVKMPERFAEVIAAVAAQKPEMDSRQPQHRPLAASWLHAERWADEPPEPAKPAPDLMISDW